MTDLTGEGDRITDRDPPDRKLQDTACTEWLKDYARDDDPPVERGDLVTVNAIDSLTGSAIGPEGYCVVMEVREQERFPFPDETGYEASVSPIATSSDRSTWGCSNLDLHDGGYICGGCGQPCGAVNNGDGPRSTCCEGSIAFR